MRSDTDLTVARADRDCSTLPRMSDTTGFSADDRALRAAPISPDGLPAGAYDVIVVGAGVAGLALTLRLPPQLRVALLTKGALGESNTRYAQGGLSAAVGVDDSSELHLADTLVAGAGLCDVDAVRELVDGAPEAVRWLIELGAQFDAGPDGVPLLGREAAHSRRRVLHAGGDATGAEIERALVARVHEDPRVDVYAGAFALDLIVRGGRCAGVVAELTPGAPPVRLEAPATVLAAGGAGQLWATTSNPPGATADGVAMALRACVPVADLEFVQFHPTVLAMPNARPFLITEAIRGEGAWLRGAHGERFMVDLHPLAELAPRDVVARGIQQQMAADGARSVWLDLRHLDAAAMRERFPTIRAELARRGLDLATDLIPVAPAAHYFIGGVIANGDGHTALPGLLAVGEAACTGVHGANRLASNSLLEGLVFGIRAAEEIGHEVSPAASAVDPAVLSAAPAAPKVDAAPVAIAELRALLQQTMSRHVAVVRDAAGLRAAADELAAIDQALRETNAIGRAAWETRNMALAARAVVAAAAHREESRGAHFRDDFPEPDPALAGRHSLFVDDAWQFGTLENGRSKSVLARP
ncbi:MAG: L-aspartate oxidase [Thermomicrobiales bacterium]|nr:L-aspartate oxidase [Thermomicrobiales bacterium]